MSSRSSLSCHIVRLRRPIRCLARCASSRSHDRRWRRVASPIRLDPDETVAEALSSLSGPPPDRIVVFRFYMHDIAVLLPPAWRSRAEIDCDDWEAGTAGASPGSPCAAATSPRRGKGLPKRRAMPASNGTFADLCARACRRLRGCGSVAPADRSAPHPGESEQDRRRGRAFARSSPAGSRTLLFVGALFYPPNEDAMLWFGKAVLPELRRLAPDVRIVAAGRAEQSLQRQLARDGIDYVHAPEDLRPLYAEAAAVIAPLRGGGGTKLKVLEAWEHERALVATSHAMRGLVAARRAARPCRRPAARFRPGLREGSGGWEARRAAGARGTRPVAPPLSGGRLGMGRRDIACGRRRDQRRGLTARRWRRTAGCRRAGRGLRCAALEGVDLWLEPAQTGQSRCSRAGRRSYWSGRNWR